MRLKDKVAIVTGGHSGIGRGCVETLIGEGAIVYAADRTPSPFGTDDPRLTSVALDVSRADEWASLAAMVAAAHGGLDLLVNNAGIGFFEGIHDTSLEAWNQVIAVDQTGVMLGMQACLPLLRERRGNIVNIASIFGIIAIPGMAAYHAAKGAVTAMTRNAAISYADWGVRVNAIHPGLIDTPSLRSRGPEAVQGTLDATPLGVMGSPRDVAMAVLYLGSDEARFVTGASLVVDGGYTVQ
ncbi:SDR family NAD(P)-dependent oxidoreductase [Rhizorhabdus wittichii]|jgi:NAD(P)-dependent dehydrogenase (short-subunit alcohol dehydrogenase family)|uniref:Short-chain dehydrogenase/reductase SDR n=1 Tax=Rhizorhabdus wittichii (strain DSM 6014 / CCUG 31198 / JCM 15750 / NBRC 105917 / EY 4224 / RW1) TaxID=392499 RepID=A0A9J9LDR4_RHIWR|nr:SDR family oxidoreductase [Rhizorhabdus wittichii]ABQ67296.1 short-chain dehydrogenase/reductase SDR [Rhizorhabdus wittichii RW1]ARR55915.1 short-chain dehydrogenase [Rhizorhabdus wittichii DC-6]